MRPIRLLLVSEGQHELAMDDPICPLGELVKRILSSLAANRVELVRMKVGDNIVGLHRNEVRGKSKDYEKRALLWMKYAQKNSFDGLVLLADLDKGKDDRVKGLTAAQERTEFAIPRALGIAVRTFDAWMLADTAALSRILGTTNRQPDPESIKDPKETCRQLCQSGDNSLSLTDFYLQVALTADLSEIDLRCPQGFSPFRERITAMAQRILPAAAIDGEVDG